MSAFLVEWIVVFALLLAWAALWRGVAALRRRRRYRRVRADLRLCRHAWIRKADGRRLYLLCLHCGAETPGLTLGSAPIRSEGRP